MGNSSEINGDPSSVRPDVDPTMSHRRRNRALPRDYSSRSHSWSRRSRLLLLVIIVLVVIDFFTALLLGTHVYRLNHENLALRANLARAENELHKVAPELEQLRIDLEKLIRGKLPRLRELKYDRVLPLDEAYLKNITFTEIINRDSRAHEYKLVVQNNTSAPLWPEIQLLVFNELGIQVGKAEIGTSDPNALKAGSLGVGEVRSYSAAIQFLDKNAMPAYFMLRISEWTKNPVQSLELETKGK